MNEFLRVRIDELPGSTMLWNASTYLATGALLGVLVGIPYDRLLGLSPSLCTILQSVMATAAFTGLTARELPEFRAHALPQNTASRPGEGVFEVIGRARRKLGEKARHVLASMEHIPSTLKVQLSTHKLGAS